MPLQLIKQSVILLINNTGCLFIGSGPDASTDAREAIYADDATHGALNGDAPFVVKAVACTAQAFDAVARRHGF